VIHLPASPLGQASKPQPQATTLTFGATTISGAELTALQSLLSTGKSVLSG
jgi:hypothetical protein